MKEHFLCGAQGLAIGYGKTPLLSDICLGVQPGQILTLIGPNGAGKSTLLRMLAGQLAQEVQRHAGRVGRQKPCRLHRYPAGAEAGPHGPAQPPDGADHLL